ncbi:hypothetical protein [Vulgatibacter sp.]|uniref:hypothetical protein n=1 Tax=Vulgatibacter sp. TaxID=1971226 RepID=UPI003565BFA0
MATRTSGRKWAAQPEMSDEAVRAATGRGWDAWCDLIDAWPGRGAGHGAIAAFLQDEQGVEGWWAQTVTVGYERITGLRLPWQRPDGTFEANLSRTITVDAAALRERLLDPTARAALFPDVQTELRSRPTSKNVRLAIGPGTAELAIQPVAGGRVKVTVQHAKLPSAEAVQEWKAFWAAWLAARDERSPS